MQHIRFHIRRSLQVIALFRGGETSLLHLHLDEEKAHKNGELQLKKN